MLHYRLSWDHREAVFEHIEHLVEINVKVGLLHGFLLQELLEFLLFLVDLEPVHIIIFFIVRVDVVIASILRLRSETGCLELGLLEVPVEGFVLATLFGHLVEVELQSKEFLNLFR